MKPSARDLLTYPEFPMPFKDADTVLNKQKFIKRVVHKNYIKHRETVSGFTGPYAMPAYDEKSF